jgi:hypothetical protein
MRHLNDQLAEQRAVIRNLEKCVHDNLLEQTAESRNLQDQQHDTQRQLAETQNHATALGMAYEQAEPHSPNADASDIPAPAELPAPDPPVLLSKAVASNPFNKVWAGQFFAHMKNDRLITAFSSMGPIANFSRRQGVGGDHIRLCS